MCKETQVNPRVTCRSVHRNITLKNVLKTEDTDRRSTPAKAREQWGLQWTQQGDNSAYVCILSCI